MKPRILSLCSGYGGLDLAVEDVFDAVTAAHCEWEAAPSLVLAHRWPGLPNLHDVKTADWSQVHAEIVTAGYPCQPFSHAGQRKGTDDERHLWPHIAAAIRRVRPRIVVLENVAGHRSMGFGDVLGELAEDGYDAQWTSLRAADVGAAHNRERIFIVATDATGGGCERRTGEHWRESNPRGGDLGLQAERRDEARPGRDVPPADAANLGHERSRAARHGRAGSADGDRPIADADGSGSQGRESAAGRHLPARGAAADADRDGLQGVRGLESVRCDLDGRGSADAAWGQYEPAIRRWERRLGRLAPAPTETGAKGGQRLSPRFVEWMMGMPAGWVTDVPGISRNDQLKMLGNGVVPQQAAEALRRLLVVAGRAA